MSMKKEKTPSLEGHEAMEKWNPTWKHHIAPIWFKKLVRRWAIKNGKWRPGDWAGIHLPHMVFDHWGKVKIGSELCVVTQPYGDFFEEAERFANEIGCSVTNEGVGPWNPKTSLYVFREKPSKTS